MYSDAGDLVLDPRCDDPAATSLVEAIRLDRNALGITSLDPERTADAIVALQDAKRAGAAGEARLLVGLGEPRHLARLLAHQAGGLLERSCAGAELRDVARHPCGSVALVLLLNPIPEVAQGDELIAVCAALLRPGGFLIATPPHDSGTSDPVAGLVELAEEHGLSYWQHVIALAVPIRAGALRVADSDGQRCHADVVVLRKPTAGNASDADAGRRSP